MPTLKPITPLQPLMQANVKPPSPMLAPEQQPLKPPSPLHPKNAPKTAFSHPQRRCRFQPHTRTSEQRRRRFHARDFRCPRAMAGPGRATSGRPTLQTSSNQRNSNRLARTSVTNVVNLSPKTSIFSKKADGLTTFVTTGQKSTRKTPWIDDVCNNTHRATHQRPGAAGVEGAGGSGGHGRASRSTTPSEARVWRSRGRPGPTAPATPAEPQAPPNGEASELLVVLRVLVGLAAVGAAERADRSHLLRRQREGEDVEVLALALRVTGLGQGHGAELVVPAQDEA